MPKAMKLVDFLPEHAHVVRRDRRGTFKIVDLVRDVVVFSGMTKKECREILGPHVLFPEVSGGAIRQAEMRGRYQDALSIVRETAIRLGRMANENDVTGLEAFIQDCLQQEVVLGDVSPETP